MIIIFFQINSVNGTDIELSDYIGYSNDNTFYSQKLGKKFVKITGNKVPFHYLSMWKFYSNCYCSLVVLKTITKKEPGVQGIVLTTFKNPCKNDFIDRIIATI